MPVTRSSDNPAKPMDLSHFNGAVHAQDLGTYDAPNGSVLLVSFAAGVHSNWHRHTEGQFLYVTDGRGRVGTRDGVVESLAAGDLVHAPPGEEHWHGATEDEGVSHLAVSLGTTEWLEEVDE
jgi:quercetin dioxygenase-like cupin family protein